LSKEIIFSQFNTWQEPTLVECLKVTHILYKNFQALPKNISLVWNYLQGTNALAYFCRFNH